jgi:2-iminobutanoate/2-iminopropanoate deaminase
VRGGGGRTATLAVCLAVGLAACSAGPHRAVATDRAPAAIATYSQAIVASGTLYTAGQIALDPSSGQMVTGGIEAETRRVLDNLTSVLEAAGYSWGDVVQVQAFLVDLDDYAVFNATYAEYVGRPAPARMVVGVAGLPRNARVEVALVAVAR